MFIWINVILLEIKCDLKKNHKKEQRDEFGNGELDERENCFKHFNIYSFVTYFGISINTLTIQLIKLINN